MFRLLFVLFVIVPIIEIAVIMQVGAAIGAWPTVAVVILTAWLGAKNVRQQGLATLQQVQTKMAYGEMPSDEIVTGLLLLVAGVLLVTPGFVTDVLGLSLLVPQIRAIVIQSVQQQLVKNSSPVQFGFHGQTFDSSATEVNRDSSFKNIKVEQQSPQGKTIDGDFERKE